MKLLQLFQESAIMGIFLQQILAIKHDSLFYPATEAQYFHKGTFSRRLFTHNKHYGRQSDVSRINNWAYIFNSYLRHIYNNECSNAKLRNKTQKCTSYFIFLYIFTHYTHITFPPSSHHSIHHPHKRKNPGPEIP